MVVAVTGGRDYADIGTVRRVLSSLEPRPTLIIHGGATGADSLAGMVAKDLGIPVEVFEADWKKNGRAAGPIRNQAMCDRKPDLLIAFPGGRGTADMTRRAKSAGIHVLEA